MWMIKNSDGKRDMMATLTVISFVVVMFKVLFGGTNLSMLDWTVTIDPIDPLLATGLLGTNTAGYVARRHSDKVTSASFEEMVADSQNDQGGE